MLLHTLQDASLACCSCLCVSGLLFTLVSIRIARAAGQGLMETVGGLVDGGGLLGLLGLNSLGDILENGLDLLGGGNDNDNRR